MIYLLCGVVDFVLWCSSIMKLKIEGDLFYYSKKKKKFFFEDFLVKI